jgi:hypothetical protein
VATVGFAEYLRRLERSRLIEPAGIDFELERYQNGCAPDLAEDVAGFAAYLKKQDALTDWQHARLMEGRTKRLRIRQYALLESYDLVERGAYAARADGAKECVMLWLRRRSAAPGMISAADLAASLSAIRSPYVLQVMDGGDVDAEEEYLVEQWGPAWPLPPWRMRALPTGSQNPFVVARVIAQAGRGFAALPGVHPPPGLVMPGAIYVDEEHRVKVSALYGQWDTSMTWRERSEGGRIDYLAPEQPLGQGDARSGVYSLGCVLYYTLMGTPPFPEGTLAQRLVQHRETPPPPLRNVPPPLADLCHRMLAKRPEDRPTCLEHACELLESLE